MSQLALEGVLSQFLQQSSQTSEGWNDPVQRRFYNEFVNGLPMESTSFMFALTAMEMALASAKSEIDSLR